MTKIDWVSAMGKNTFTRTRTVLSNPSAFTVDFEGVEWDGTTKRREQIRLRLKYCGYQVLSVKLRNTGNQNVARVVFAR